MVTVQVERKEVKFDIRNLEGHGNLLERVEEMVVLTPPAGKWKKKARRP